MRKRSSGIMSLAVLALTPGLSQAQVTLGPTLAFGDDADFGIGATVRSPLSGFGEGVGLMADFIIFFPEGTDVNYFEIDGNVTYDFPVENSTAVPFVLAGLNFARGSSGGVSNTELGLNLGGGVEFDAGTLRPVVAARIELEGGKQFVIFASLPFQVGN